MTTEIQKAYAEAESAAAEAQRAAKLSAYGLYVSAVCTFIVVAVNLANIWMRHVVKFTPDLICGSDGATVYIMTRDTVKDSDGKDVCDTCWYGKRTKEPGACK